MRPLYQINKDLDYFEFEISEDGEVLNLDAFEAIEMEKTAKIEGAILKRKNIAAMAEARKQEIASLQKLLKDDQAQIDSLDDWIKDALNGEKFKTDKCAVSYRKSTSVSVKDEDSVLKYLRASGHADCIKTTETFNKMDVKKLLQQHIQVPGAELLDHINVVIK